MCWWEEIWESTKTKHSIQTKEYQTIMNLCAYAYLLCPDGCCLTTLHLVPTKSQWFQSCYTSLPKLPW